MAQLILACYKHQDRNSLLLPVVLSEQIFLGSFAFALDYLVDHELDLTAMDAPFNNDDTLSPSELMKQAIDSPEGRRQKSYFWVRGGMAVPHGVFQQSGQIVVRFVKTI